MGKWGGKKMTLIYQQWQKLFLKTLRILNTIFQQIDLPCYMILGTLSYTATTGTM